jgi:hypothetical protein
MSIGQVLLIKMSVGKMSVGQIFFDQETSNPLFVKEKRKTIETKAVFKLA